MKIIILYDSIYGNTALIAEAIAEAFEKPKLITADKVLLSDIKDANLLIVGSPVHGGRPTQRLEAFLKNIPPHCLNNMYIGAFDTRFAQEDHGPGLRILMSIIRFAAARISKMLIQKGALQIVKPEGFIVIEKAGPLKPGELERAKRWGVSFLQAYRRKVK